MRAPILGLLLLALVGTRTRRAFADDKVTCVRAADAAQEQRTAGRLLEARASLHACARDVCPGLVKSDCTQWLAEVEASMPTIVIRAQNERGDDVIDVQVDVDGRRVTDKLEGLPMDVDPGPHTLVWHRGSRSGRQEIVVHTAERNRTVTLRVETGEPLRVAATSDIAASAGAFRPGPAAWILAGIAVAGTASFAYFGLRGTAEVRDMRAECAGHCPASRVDAARDKLLAADISLGLAVVSAGVATYLFWNAATPSPGMPARQVHLSPIAGGVAAFWLERF